MDSRVVKPDKKWSTMFRDKLQHLEDVRRIEDERKQAERKEEILLRKASIQNTSQESQRMGIKALQGFVKDHMRSLKTWHQKVVPLADYPSHLAHQILCLFCKKPCLHDSLPCRSCSSVAHRLCLPMIDKDLIFNCLDCIQVQESLEAYRLKKIEATDQERHIAKYADIMGRRLLTFHHRRIFKKKKKCIVKVQAIGRLMIARNTFLKFRASQLRIIVLDNLNIPILNINTGLVILSIFDSAMKQQISRVDKSTMNAMEEGFLIAGISNYYLIVLTFCSCDPQVSGQYTIVGQSLLSLRDPRTVFNVCTYQIPISTNIDWFPVDSTEDGANKFNLLLPPNSETIMKGTSIVIRLNPIKSALSQCCSAIGPGYYAFQRPGDRIILRDAEKLAKLRALVLKTDIPQKKRYWLCCFNLTCYIYPDFGDLQPRFVLSLRDAEVALSEQTSRTVCLVFGDNRALSFELANRKEAAKFVFIVKEGREILSGTSKFQKVLTDYGSFGHINPTL